MSDAPAYLCAAISICESGLNIAYHIRYPDAQVVLPVCLGNIAILNLFFLAEDEKYRLLDCQQAREPQNSLMARYEIAQIFHSLL